MLETTYIVQPLVHHNISVSNRLQTLNDIATTKMRVPGEQERKKLIRMEDPYQGNCIFWQVKREPMTGSWARTNPCFVEPPLFLWVLLNITLGSCWSVSHNPHWDASAIPESTDCSIIRMARWRSNPRCLPSFHRLTWTIYILARTRKIKLIAVGFGAWDSNTALLSFHSAACIVKNKRQQCIVKKIPG